MNAKQLRAKGAQELLEELNSLLKAHFSLRMQQATQQLTNPSELGKTRRTLARVRTILAEKARRA